MDGANTAETASHARDGSATEATAPTNEEQSLETTLSGGSSTTTAANRTEPTSAVGFVGGAQPSSFNLANQGGLPSSYTRSFGPPPSSSFERIFGAAPSSYDRIFGGPPNTFQIFSWSVSDTDRNPSPDDGVDLSDNDWDMYGPGIPAAEIGEDDNASPTRNHDNVILTTDDGNTTSAGDDGVIITPGDDGNTISAGDDGDAILAGGDEDNAISAGDDDNLMTSSFAARMGIA